MIFDLFKISGNNEAILEFSEIKTVQPKNDNVQAFDTMLDDGLSVNMMHDSVCDRLVYIITERIS